MSLPRVSILVSSSRNGRELTECLAALDEQSYPSDRISLDVNGAVERCDGDYIAFITDEVKPDSHWLRALVERAEACGAAAVAGTVLDGPLGTARVAGRGLSFVGFPTGLPQGQEDLLYASRESALVRRSALLDAGGLDTSFGGCLDDVDLGWRLNLAGHAVVLAPDAVAYRSEALHVNERPSARRIRQLERNALATIFKNYDDRTLSRVLPAAIALCLYRGLLDSGIDALRLELSSKPAETATIAPRLAAHLIALEDFTRGLAALERARAVVQGIRRRSDAEVIPLFGHALELGGDDRVQVLARTLVRDFGIDEVFGGHPSGTTAFHASQAPTEPVVRVSTADTSAVPKVSVVILTALGPTHLPECLASLRQQTYPGDRIEVIVVDNGSAQDPTAEATRGYPGARVILNGTNLGFARGNNIGAAASTGDYLVFLNDDTRVEPSWLEEMMATVARHRTTAVASYIVDWSGTRVDFVDSAVNFQGKGFQLHYDAARDSLSAEEKPLLFGCGCALLVERGVFFDAGQWDEGTFAYYEDVELGWRLNLLHHDVWLSPRAIVYHKHHGTSGQWPEPPRLRLYERNSLRMLYALLDQESLRRALPAALLLASDRALLGTTLSRAHDEAAVNGAHPTWRRLTPGLLTGRAKDALRRRGVARRMQAGGALRHLGVHGALGVLWDVLVPRGATPSMRAAYTLEQVPVVPATDVDVSAPMGSVAALAGIFAFLHELPELTKRRAHIQSQRMRSDHEVLSTFGSHWLQACPAPLQPEHDAAQAAVVRHFRIDDLRSMPPT